MTGARNSRSSEGERITMSAAQQTIKAAGKDKNSAFNFHSDNATAVFLAGSFNNWSPTTTPMLKGKDGDWAVSLPLASGRYEYKFVVDGEWCCEPEYTHETAHVQNCVTNEFGTMNHVLEVL
jgi:1,4-alpha-glucan branching enzyme